MKSHQMSKPSTESAFLLARDSMLSALLCYRLPVRYTGRSHKNGWS